MSKLYLAYGSNMNIKQMAHRCPTAKVKGVSDIRGWKLVFRGHEGNAVATIEPCEGEEVPVLLWDIETKDEKALDRYEGYPYLYRKENIYLRFDGKLIKAMVYIMNDGRDIGSPSLRYYQIIKQGYVENGIDVRILGRFLQLQEE